MTAPPDTGIGGSANPYQGSVASFARSVVEVQGRNAETAKNLDSGQQIVVKRLHEKAQPRRISVCVRPWAYRLRECAA